MLHATTYCTSQRSSLVSARCSDNRSREIYRAKAGLGRQGRGWERGVRLRWKHFLHKAAPRKSGGTKQFRLRCRVVRRAPSGHRRAGVCCAVSRVSHTVLTSTAWNTASHARPLRPLHQDGSTVWTPPFWSGHKAALHRAEHPAIHVGEVILLIGQPKLLVVDPAIPMPLNP